MPRAIADTLALAYQTRASRTRAGWDAFYLARDLFLHEQLRRQGEGFVFGSYRAPDGHTVPTLLTRADLRQHTLVLGATGTGKSTLLSLLARAHVDRGQPFALLDLHGDLFTHVSDWLAAVGVRGVTRIDFTRPATLPSWNPLAAMPDVDVGRQVDLLVGVLKRLYASETASSWAWGVKVEELTRYALRAAIESDVPCALADLRGFFLNPAYRAAVLASASIETRAYFLARFGAREQMYVSAVLNKLEPFLGSAAVQRFLGADGTRVDLLGVMDRGEILLVNCAKGYLGLTADVIGRLLVNALQVAALRRERLAYASRRPYALLLDEGHALAAVESGLEDFLVAARKYRVAVTLAAQGLSLFPPAFRPHLLGNTGRQFFFRMPYGEARTLAPDLFEALGDQWRDAVRPYDDVAGDPLLAPAEELAARTRELANLPIGACYWLLKGRRYKARRIHVSNPRCVVR
jgi:energy-coupling factor transporter ATP-binding protein EcfA2